MGVFTYLLRDVEQILFPNREQHAIPSMDGALSPNDRLDACTPIGEPIPGVDDALAGGDGALYVSAGKQVLRLSGEGFRERAVFVSFDGNAGGLAFHPDGNLLVCVSGKGLAAVDRSGRQTWLNQVADQPLNCLTAVVAGSDGGIFAANGSSRNVPEHWCVDLMQKNRLGRLVACGPGFAEPRVLLDGLHYPHGLAILARRPQPVVHRKLEPSCKPGAIAGPHHGQGGSRERQPAGLSGTADQGARWRLLAQHLCRAHAPRRVRAARGRFPRGNDAYHRAGAVGRAGARHDWPLPRADAVRLDQGARHPEAVGAAALVRLAGAHGRGR